MIKWKDEYSVGVEKIDEQHKHLFEIANKVHEVLNNDFYTDKYDKIVEILKELEDYTVFHFNDEEEYMKQIGYKKFFTHKIEHEEFVQKIKNVDLGKIDCNQDKYLLEIMNFIVNWLVNHILQKDKLY
ncbi:bacteriohemerythrin [Clostridium frigidicarnis]|uniref:Hemerythrin n=1 Tax=Clostridium frigidicarnis TaxID=84698 RepID=A0A1I1AC52_9CLOT|nr:bacteriohemerythrin [Clostridium frigidicarnis]SFB35575.1 hemerythrin [Clostridium frigidicarnis]